MILKTKLVPVALVGALAVTACTPTDVDTGNPRQRLNEGIIGGSIVGAITGAVIGGDAEGAVIGAVAGGALGAAIGHDLDRQAAELRQSLGDGRIQIINQGDYLIVRMPQDILFAVDSTSVSPALQSDLRALAANLQRYPNSTVEVVGHTDNSGTAAYNQDLSQRRAGAVSSLLVAYGVSAGRLRAIGRGEDAPIASNLTPEGRAQNRRVDILIRPTR